MSNSSEICVDASIIVRLVAGEEAERPAYQLRWDQWVDAGSTIVAPTLLQYEVTNALYRYQRAGVRSEQAVRRSLEAALLLPIQLHDGGSDLHLRALAWARRYALPAAYDAHYLVLADRRGAEFWTTDQRLFNTVRHVLPWVYFVGQ